ncbi:hypothetical protein OHA25_52640 [Nonomuraea sp. NBC_00507]|uniref:hypothetical protein n=1 Tax=Nonomuraea sp. NBC_00507 TaxID=2976002 RepID=UPI002E1A0057
MNLKSRSTRIRLVAVAGTLAVLAGGGQLAMSHATADPDPCSADASVECTDASLAAAAMPDDETDPTEDSAGTTDAAAADETEEPVSEEITVKTENWDAVSEATLEAEQSTTDEATDSTEDTQSTEDADSTESTEDTGSTLDSEDTDTNEIDSNGDGSDPDAESNSEFAAETTEEKVKKFRQRAVTVLTGNPSCDEFLDFGGNDATETISKVAIRAYPHLTLKDGDYSYASVDPADVGTGGKATISLWKPFFERDRIDQYRAGLSGRTGLTTLANAVRHWSEDQFRVFFLLHETAHATGKLNNEHAWKDKKGTEGARGFEQDMIEKGCVPKG